MSLAALQEPKGISYEDFLATIDEGTHAEWVDGGVKRKVDLGRGCSKIEDERERGLLCAEHWLAPL